MPIRLGNKNVLNVKLGNRQVNKIYLGNDLVWQKVIPLDTRTQAILNRATLEGFTLPSPTIISNIDNLIKGMRLEANYWATRDNLQMYIYNDDTLSNFSRINWVDPTGALATIGGSGLTYTVNGFKGGGNGFLDTKWNPSTGLNTTLNSIGISHIIWDDHSVSASRIMGINQTAPNRRLAVFPRISLVSSGSLFANDLDATSQEGNFNAKRIYHFGRENNQRFSSYDSTRDIKTVPAVAPINSVNYYLNAGNNNGSAYAFCNGTVGMFSGGGYFNETSGLAIKTLLNNYLTSIGKPI